MGTCFVRSKQSMCGIAGIVSKYSEINNTLSKVNPIQLHRGPDAQGCLQTHVGNWQVGLAHQRLAIMDLSEAAKQPMVYGEAEGYLIYNGEVYNYKEIRTELEGKGCKFINKSDTEVVLTALHHWGIEKAVKCFNGMWAFAWLDTIKNRLILARDRFGVKPLYFYKDSNALFFASEIKTILEMVPQKFELNYQVVGEYLLQSLSETSNETFFKGIYKMPPGHFAIIDLNSSKLSIDFEPYWDLKEDTFIPISEKELIEKLRELFFDSVKLRLRSDVPVGILLSGGLDSSAIAAVMHAVLGSGGELNLLSAVSMDRRFDESPYIDIMGKHLDHRVHKVVLDLNPDNAFELLEKVCWFNDEPVGSFSNVAHYLLMQKAVEQGITVILTGQGADEILCGYKKYLGFYMQQLIRAGTLGKALMVAGNFLINGAVINQFSAAEARRYLPKSLLPNIPDIRGDALVDYQSVFVGLAPQMSVRERQVLDLNRFSVPVLTHTEDRMSMAWSREIRVPFLDYRLVEFLINLPVELKIKKGWTKYILRKTMEPYLPSSITWRKDKQGFVNPQSEWLKHRLKDQVLNYFSPEGMIFKYDMVRRNELLSLYEMYCKQKAGRGIVWFKDIFNPLALEIWLRQYERYLL